MILFLSLSADFFALPHVFLACFFSAMMLLSLLKGIFSVS